LELLRVEHSKQTSRVEELESANSGLREQVVSLSSRVDELTDAQRRLTEELRVEKLAVVEAQALQVKTARQLEETMS
ncbi:hypothetical protein, partial [Legionella sp. 28fT52]|uniref:hypothetical protein n=1 Tax=Legionella sp. 28fT52 TaxID=3410134 RepID=UPI003AF834BF